MVAHWITKQALSNFDANVLNIRTIAVSRQNVQPHLSAPVFVNLCMYLESASEDIDELLDLKPVRKAKTTKTTSHNYDWVISQPMKNLHEGKASNGKDYSKTSKGDRAGHAKQSYY